MISNRLSDWFTFAMTGAVLLMSGTSSHGQSTEDKVTTSKQYFADVSAFSFIPKQGIDTVSGSNNRAGVGPSGTLGLTVSRHGSNQRFDVTVAARQERGRFLAKLSVNSITGDKIDEKSKLQRELDLTDLQPQVVEIARDDDGRVYRVNVYPRVIEAPLSKTFHLEDLELDRWSFNESSVILNDQDYLGTLSMSSGSLAWVDIPGLALVEFSLKELKGAQPEGFFKDGKITITHGSTLLEINNVLNGSNREILKGGPYRVFVRWKNPSHTVEQYRELLKAQVQNLKKQVISGDSNVSPEVISTIERMADSNRVYISSSGMGPVPKEDRVDQRP